MFTPASLSKQGQANPDFWDPVKNFDRTLSPYSLRRFQSDMKEVRLRPLPGIFVCPDESVASIAHALLIGPEDTPYAGGFFHFLVNAPDNYPHEPPRVKLLTTDGNSVRFNPNLYANGKVCLSILNTWSGPAWTAVQTVGSVLLSIQSLMNSKPLHNEPGFENEERHPGDAERYNEIIRHETLRVAVCGMVETALKEIEEEQKESQDGQREMTETKTEPGQNSAPAANSASAGAAPAAVGASSSSATAAAAATGAPAPSPTPRLRLPGTLRQLMVDYFKPSLSLYEEQARKGRDSRVEGRRMEDPFEDPRGKFEYAKILQRLQALRERLGVPEGEEEDEDDEDEEDEDLEGEESK
uniref:Ubiquitin-conjugating enzyme E2 Z n=1 Tax=Chromera velia CCMP2878 TaxID=1169474 RepID=A0A0G4HYP7_9ALVE|mmetsp:Transcript_20537/g.41057  ORF Transcript_20537/g.41057 Transcript_20537/m.41057 type:complete len:355 (-) Transcript_20537:251-1315(-)|eukprot:Cvel_9543.t1-p1 / transcript=Cvel_9543.t1 / gene=Cvel_9543 / organism=Chromera_velia_CCMP2878 / gene_product=Ubiquitin-conjugating enzyme E2 Z, putative / transcript_product=Ubiquitin-conjugating enzyme E2 Z, putative / location=Cvel_scaffold553:2069-5893(+) / protein_length=354 / sequence_SO=supercontig / SO=protein_coding / is_pseudo=false